jgi:hypothetical protein
MSGQWVTVGQFAAGLKDLPQDQPLVVYNTNDRTWHKVKDLWAYVCYEDKDGTLKNTITTEDLPLVPVQVLDI